MTPILFIGMWLASYRITRLITKDSILLPFRKRWFKRFPPNGDYAKISNYPVSMWGELFNCPWCIGWWISGICVLIVAHLMSIPLPILWWCAISSAVGLTGSRLDA